MNTPQSGNSSSFSGTSSKNYPLQRVQHRQSKLDLLDSSRMTSFPQPSMTSSEDSHSVGRNTLASVKEEKQQQQQQQQEPIQQTPKYSITYSKDGNRSRTNTITLHRIKSTPTIGTDVYDEIKTLSIASKKELDSEATKCRVIGSNPERKSIILSNKDFSMSNSFDLEDNPTYPSKVITPLSSLDYESDLYDYRLVLESSSNSHNGSKNKISKKLTANRGEPSPRIYPVGNDTCTTVKSSEYPDMYIQSMYENDNISQERGVHLKCKICQKNVFDGGKYINNEILTLENIECESCLRNRDRNNNNNIEPIITEDMELELPLDSLDLETDTSLDQTNNNTIQLDLDTTIQTGDPYFLDDRERDGDGAGENEQREVCNVSDNKNLQNIFVSPKSETFRELDHEDDDKVKIFGGVINRLKTIERNDLRIRQSISDFRTHDYENENQMRGKKRANEDSSIWVSIKNRFRKN